VFYALVLAAALNTAPQPTFCGRPQSRADGIICADAELRALALASVRVSLDVAASHHIEWYAVGSLEWPAALDDCATAECVRAAYEERLSDLFEQYEVRLPRAHHYRGSAGKHGWSGMIVDDLGGGWALIWMQAGYNNSRPDNPQPDTTCSAVGVTQIIEGKAHLGEPSGGLQLERIGASQWKVTPTGAFDCGNRVHLDGIYRRRG